MNPVFRCHSQANQLVTYLGIRVAHGSNGGSVRGPRGVGRDRRGDGYVPIHRAGAAMEMITLPGTSLRVSRICLGTQQFSNNWEWPME